MARCYLMVEDTPEGGLVWAADYGTGQEVLDEEAMTDAQFVVFNCIATLKRLQDVSMAPRVVTPMAPKLVLPPGLN